MIYGLYQSAAGMMVNEYRQNVIANNLANAETVGFKRQVATFAERLQASEAGIRRGANDRRMDGLTGGIWLGRTDIDFSEGGVVNTGNPLDVALDGPGFLMVASEGYQLLTRDGRMITDRDGRLLAVTDGAPILGQGGTPIRINPQGGPPSIDVDGRIHQDGVEVARLAIVDVADYRTLAQAGTGRYIAADSEPVEADARVLSGYVERSGVQPVRELVTMLEAARAYQINAQMISLQDQGLGRLINEVARV